MNKDEVDILGTMKKQKCKANTEKCILGYNNTKKMLH